jgi:hypothetical protein
MSIVDAPQCHTPAIPLMHATLLSWEVPVQPTLRVAMVTVKPEGDIKGTGKAIK